MCCSTRSANIFYVLVESHSNIGLLKFGVFFFWGVPMYAHKVISDFLLGGGYN